MKNNFSEVRFLDPEVQKEWKEISAPATEKILPEPQSLLCGAYQIDPETGIKQPVQLLIKAKTFSAIMEAVNGNHA